MLSITNTTGSRRTPARFMPSCASPRADAPSPHQATATRFSSRIVNARRHAHRDRQHRGQVADHRVQPESGVADVDVPVAAARRAVDAAHVLREDAPRLDAARDVDTHVALQRRADVVRPHRGRDADRGRLRCRGRCRTSRGSCPACRGCGRAPRSRASSSMLRYMPSRSSRSRPASFTSCSVPTGSASRTAMFARSPFPGRRSAETLATRVADGPAPVRPATSGFPQVEEAARGSAETTPPS